MGAVKALYILEQMRKDELTRDTKVVKVKATMIHSTTKAILISAKVVIVKVKSWLPKSQIIEPDPIALKLIKDGEELTAHIPLWLAKTNGLTTIRR